MVGAHRWPCAAMTPVQNGTGEELKVVQEDVLCFGATEHLFIWAEVAIRCGANRDLWPMDALCGVL